VNRAASNHLRILCQALSSGLRRVWSSHALDAHARADVELTDLGLPMQSLSDVPQCDFIVHGPCRVPSQRVCVILHTHRSFR
jgi:hypothetical protein